MKLSRCTASTRSAWPLFALALPCFSQANTNDLGLHHAKDSVFKILSNPSVGAPPGTYPPDLDGDLFWKVLPGDRVMAHQGEAGNVMMIDGFLLVLGDTDYSTEPWFYDILIGPAKPSLVNPGNLEPSFLQDGLTTEVIVSLGPFGAFDPCSIPGACDPDGCWYSGDIPWFWFNMEFEEGIVVPADGSSASDLCVTWFYPGGMTMPDLSSPCAGASDFTVQNVHATSESQADDLGGISAYGGWRTAGQPPTPDPVNEGTAISIGFRERILNVIADSGAGFELGIAEGGATNGLKLSVSGGDARLSFEVRAHQDAEVPNLACVGVSASALGPPGPTLLGASLLVDPDALFSSSLTSALTSSVSVVRDTLPFEEGIARFWAPESPGVPLVYSIPAPMAGIDLFSQGGVIRLTEFTVHHTNRVRTSLLP